MIDQIKKQQRSKEVENKPSRKAAEKKENIKKVQLRENFPILSVQEVFTSFIIWILPSLDSIIIRKFLGKRELHLIIIRQCTRIYKQEHVVDMFKGLKYRKMDL